MAGCLIVSGLISPASAAVLVYEGFDYALASGTSMNGITSDAAGLSGDYSLSTSSSGTRSVNYSTQNLTFGPNYLPSTGGSIYLSASGTVGQNPYAVLSVAANAGTVTGTVYNSYLVQFTSLSDAVIASGGSAGPAILTHRLQDGSVRLQNIAHQATGPSTDNRPAVGYGTANHISGSGTSGTLALDTTYLVLARFTNVGLAGGGTADQFVFTLNGYNAWLAAGGQEASLGTFAVFTSTSSRDSLVSFSGTFQFGVAGKGGAESAYLDELRWGTQLSDVISMAPVPEPSAALLLLGALGIWAGRPRKKLFS